MPAIVDDAAVAALLTRSRAHHDAKLRYANRLPPQEAEAEAEIARALELRQQAHALDPGHTAPEWANDRAPHAELVAFYEEYGAIP